MTCTTAADGKTTWRYKLAPKTPAIDLLGKTLGMFARREEKTVTVNIEHMSKDEADRRLIELQAKLINDD